MNKDWVTKYAKRFPVEGGGGGRGERERVERGEGSGGKSEGERTKEIMRI